MTRTRNIIPGLSVLWGGVEEVNRFLFLEQRPMVLRLLADFVKRYNGGLGFSSLHLEREEFERAVAERGLGLYLQQKEFSQRVIEESLHKNNGGVLEIARGQRNADMAYDEKTRAFTHVRNHEKSAARSVARAKRALAEEYLRDYPELEEYYDVPDGVRMEFLQVLKKVYMMKAIENGFQKLEDVFVGFELELYLSSNEFMLRGDTPGGDSLIRREIAMLYEKKLASCLDAGDYENLSLLLLGSLENELYKKRLRPVFISGNAFGMESWMGIAELHKKFFLGKDSWRRKLRKGELQGIKEAAGKYIAEPKAGRWLVNPKSVDRFTGRYDHEGRLLIARNLGHLSRSVHSHCYALPEAAKLDGMPSVDTLRRIVKEEEIGLTALVGVPYTTRNRYGRVEPAMVVRERRVLTAGDVDAVMSY